MDTSPLREERLSHAPFYKNLASHHITALSTIILETDDPENVGAWVSALTALPEAARDVRLELVHFVRMISHDFQHLDGIIARTMWATWADDDSIREAEETFRQVYSNSFVRAAHHLPATVTDEVFDVMTNRSVPREAKHLRTVALRNLKIYPADTDWEALAEAYRHLGTPELVEDLFGVEFLFYRFEPPCRCCR